MSRNRDDRIVIYHEPHRFRHGKHLLITVITGGAWLPVWFLCWILHQD